MKKMFLTFICVLTALTFCFADNGMGVKVMGNKNNNTDPVSIDNLVVGKEVEIEDYAIVKPTEFGFFDSLGYYKQGKTTCFLNWNEVCDFGYYESKNEADFAILRTDLTNILTVSKDFLKECTVKVLFDEKYEYEGWTYQSNYDNEPSTKSEVRNRWKLEEDKGKQNKRWAIDKADNFAIEPMYKGHYIFGCTLPNTVIESTKPLKMIITLDGNKITYNIRK